MFLPPEIAFPLGSALTSEEIFFILPSGDDSIQKVSFLPSSTSFSSLNAGWVLPCPHMAASPASCD